MNFYTITLHHNEGVESYQKKRAAVMPELTDAIIHNNIKYRIIERQIILSTDEVHYIATSVGEVNEVGDEYYM